MPGTVELIEGDCRDVLREMPDQSVQCIVTSPPYFGLRDYGNADQLGLEPTPAEFVEALVGVLREARRVLADDGTLWLNLGDSYSRNPAKGGSGPNGKHDFIPDYGKARKILAANAKAGSSDGAAERGDRPGTRTAVDGLAQKQLLGIPWRVAFALQADGWYLRQDIIWHKPNPMPESVRDRCTKAHEYVFLLTKSERYYFDADAIAEPVVSVKGNAKSFRGGGSYTGGNAFDNSALKERETHGNEPNETGTRNKRDVWTIPTKGFKGAHFATFPEALVEPCILAGCPEGSTVLDPFGGSGTVGVVARRHGRNAVLVELNPEYYDIASARLWPEDVKEAAE